MKPHRRIILPLLIGMILVAFAISIAQTSGQQTNQKKQAESCCAMDSCCCHGDSCAMKTGENTDAAKSGCCSGDSCAMKTGEGTDAAKTDCCGGESCNIKMKHDAKNHAKTAAGDMKKHDKKHDMKNHDMKDGCCCCADSCDTKVKQTAG